MSRKQINLDFHKLVPVREQRNAGHFDDAMRNASATVLKKPDVFINAMTMTANMNA